MGQLLVRKVYDDPIRRFKERAAMAGRSVEAEYRLLLEQALRPGKPSFIERARRHLAATREQPHSDSAELISSDRDTNYET
jgi:plasmid stability protein